MWGVWPKPKSKETRTPPRRTPTKRSAAATARPTRDDIPGTMEVRSEAVQHPSSQACPCPYHVCSTAKAPTELMHACTLLGGPHAAHSRSPMPESVGHRGSGSSMADEPLIVESSEESVVIPMLSMQSFGEDPFPTPPRRRLATSSISSALNRTISWRRRRQEPAGDELKALVTTQPTARQPEATAQRGRTLSFGPREGKARTLSLTARTLSFGPHSLSRPLSWRHAKQGSDEPRPFGESIRSPPSKINSVPTTVLPPSPTAWGAPLTLTTEGEAVPSSATEDLVVGNVADEVDGGAPSLRSWLSTRAGLADERVLTKVRLLPRRPLVKRLV